MTKIEQARAERMMQLGCVACAFVGLSHIAHHCHHIVQGNRRLGDWFTLPLCQGHHEGQWEPEQREALGKNCVAISDGRKAFCAIYGTEQALWEIVQKRLGLWWPESKMLPRRVA